MGIITVPAFIIVVSGILSNGVQSQAVAVMDNLKSCNNLQKIIEKDFFLLREAEKAMKPENIKPRTHLNSVKCWSIKVPINGQQVREQL